MNNNDLAALAALGAMGYMYKRHLDGQGTEAGPADAAGRYPPAADFVNRDSSGGAGGIRARDVVYGGDNAAGVGTAGVDKRSDMDDFATGNGGIRARDVVYGGGTGVSKGGGKGGGKNFVFSPGSYAGNQYESPPLAAGERLAPYPEVGAGGVGNVTPEESSGMGGAGLAAAGAGAAGAGAAAYYAKVKREARLADEARARMKAEAQRGILKDRAQTGVDADRDARARAQNEADRAARAQAQAEAEAKSRAIQAEIDDELKRYKNKTKGANERAAVLNKDMWAAGPTVTRETSTKRAPVKVEAPTDMDDFNRMLRESKVGRTNTSGPTATASRASADTQTREDAKAARARARLESSGTALPVPTTTTTTTTAAPPRENAARMTAAKKAAAKQAADMEAFNKQLRESKVGLPEAKAGPAETTTSGKAPRSMRGAATPAALAAMAVLAAAPDIVSAGVQTYKGDTSGAVQSLKDSKEALKALAMLPVDVSRAAMKGDFGPLKDLAMSMNPGTLLFNEISKHDDEAIKRMIEREKAAASKKAAGGQIKAKKMASGGMISTVSSASKRGDGIASKGKTRCKLY